MGVVHASMLESCLAGGQRSRVAELLCAGPGCGLHPALPSTPLTPPLASPDHPHAPARPLPQIGKLLVELSRSQDHEIGDGTTGVTVRSSGGGGGEQGHSACLEAGCRAAGLPALALRRAPLMRQALPAPRLHPCRSLRVRCWSRPRRCWIAASTRCVSQRATKWPARWRCRCGAGRDAGGAQAGMGGWLRDGRGGDDTACRRASARAHSPPAAAPPHHHHRTQRLDEIATTFEFSADSAEPLVKTCMTTLSSKMCVHFLFWCLICGRLSCLHLPPLVPACCLQLALGAQRPAASQHSRGPAPAAPPRPAAAWAATSGRWRRCACRRCWGWRTWSARTSTST